MTMNAQTESVTQVSESYWLRNSEGFRVEGPGGRIGVVEAILDPNGQAELRIARGGLGFRSVTIPADEVESISPHELRIRLRTSPATERRAARSGHGRLRLLHPLRG
jgi:hypothetical protein